MDQRALSAMPDRRFFEEAAGVIAFWVLLMARHMPAPPASRPWLCAVFDCIQDACKNNDRVGQRRAEPAPEPRVA